MNTYFVFYLYNSTKGCKPPQHTNLELLHIRLFDEYKSIIMECSPSYFLNSDILNKYIIFDLYNDPLRLHTFYAGRRREYACQNLLKSDN